MLISGADVLPLKDEEDPKCFSRDERDFTCFFETAENRTYDLLYSSEGNMYALHSKYVVLFAEDSLKAPKQFEKYNV